MKLGGSGDSRFTYEMLMFSIIAMLLLSMFIPLFAPKAISSDAENPTLKDLENQYTDFTGSQPTSEAVWGLKGIYTPYGHDKNGNASTDWGYTEDGWLYGERIVEDTPSQYDTDDSRDAYTFTYNSESGLYYYKYTSTTINKHDRNDLYGAVVMDASKKSDIFFSTSGKTITEKGFYYQFSGYRYAFSPISKYKGIGADGNEIDVTPNTTTLSLIWYQYYTQSGIAGQLILSGSDTGVAYLTSAQIVSAFNTDTSTSRFTMTFNGVNMNILIRLDPTYIMGGMSVEECYDAGFWAIMVSSRSVDTSAYNSTDYEFNPTAIFQTMIDLLTFNTADYSLSPLAGTLMSMCIVIPLMIALIVIGLNNYPVLIFAGIYAAFTAIVAAINNGLFG